MYCIDIQNFINEFLYWFIYVYCFYNFFFYYHLSETDLFDLNISIYISIDYFLNWSVNVYIFEHYFLNWLFSIFFDVYNFFYSFSTLRELNDNKYTTLSISTLIAKIYLNYEINNFKLAICNLNYSIFPWTILCYSSTSANSQKTGLSTTLVILLTWYLVTKLGYPKRIKF